MQFATLAEIGRHQAETQPERIALTFENRDTSYATLDCRANQVANGLITAGLRPASRVALLDKNHDSFFEIWFGAAKANAVLVPVNWRLAGPEIAFIVNDAEAEILFVGAEFRRLARHQGVFRAGGHSLPDAMPRHPRRQSILIAAHHL